MQPMSPEPTTRDYDAEVAEMLSLATALAPGDALPKLVDQSAGIAGVPGIAVIATASGEKGDADA